MHADIDGALDPWSWSCYAGSIKTVPICDIGSVFMGHGGIQQVSAKRMSSGLTPAYLQ